MTVFLAQQKARDISRRSALMLCCRMANPVHEGMVRYILEKVADPDLNAIDLAGKTAVDYVMESSSTVSAKLLLEYMRLKM